MLFQQIKSITTIFKRRNIDSDDARTNLVIKSSLISFICKAGTVILGFLTLPLVYNSLDKYQYGIYATLTSIIAWIDIFDFGITQGLRNRLTEALSENNNKKAKQYVSTSYALLSLIALFILLIYLCLYRIIDWQVILNAKDIDKDLLNNISFFVFLMFLVRFVASSINKVFYALQKSYLVDVTQLVGKSVYLLLIIILSKTNTISLQNVAISQSGIAAIVPIIASLYFFNLKFITIKPSFREIKWGVTNDIMGLGWKFFIIQLSLLIIHSGNNLLISQFVDPANVSAYSVSYSLFSYAMMAYIIIITPLWSAYTEAWKLKRVVWIMQTIKKIKVIFLIFAIGCLVVASISPWIFHIWIGDTADVPIVMAFAVAIMVLMDMWIRIFDYFINGVGKIKVQMIVNVCMAVVNIPMAYLFAVICNMGAIGVVLASIISYSISAIISPVQAMKLLKGKAFGIWNE